MIAEKDPITVRPTSALNVARRRSLRDFVTLWEHLNEPWEFHVFPKHVKRRFQRIPDFFWCENVNLIHKRSKCVIGVYTDEHSESVYLLVTLPDVLSLTMKHPVREYRIRQHPEQPILAKVADLTPFTIDYWNETTVSFSQP